MYVLLESEVLSCPEGRQYGLHEIPILSSTNRISAMLTLRHTSSPIVKINYIFCESVDSSHLASHCVQSVIFAVNE